MRVELIVRNARNPHIVSNFIRLARHLVIDECLFNGIRKSNQRVHPNQSCRVSCTCSQAPCSSPWALQISTLVSLSLNKLSAEQTQINAKKSVELVYIFSNLRLLRKITAGDKVEFFYAWRKDGGKCVAAGANERSGALI